MQDPSNRPVTEAQTTVPICSHPRARILQVCSMVTSIWSPLGAFQRNTLETITRRPADFGGFLQGKGPQRNLRESVLRILKEGIPSSFYLQLSPAANLSKHLNSPIPEKVVWGAKLQIRPLRFHVGMRLRLSPRQIFIPGQCARLKALRCLQQARNGP